MSFIFYSNLCKGMFGLLLFLMILGGIFPNTMIDIHWLYLISFPLMGGLSFGMLTNSGINSLIYKENWRRVQGLAGDAIIALGLVVLILGVRFNAYTTELNLAIKIAQLPPWLIIACFASAVVGYFIPYILGVKEKP